jgi:hypothetical protein
MPQYWDFTCMASHLSTKAEFWTSYVWNGNKREQMKSYLYLYAVTISGFDRLHWKFLCIWVAL